MKKVGVGRWVSLITGILLIVCGALFLMNPLEGTVVLAQAISGVLVAVGLLKIIRCFGGEVFRTSGFLMSGILDVLVGFLMFRRIDVTLATFSFIVAFWILASSIAQVATAFDLRRVGISSWWLELLGAILGIIAGVILLGDFGLTVSYIVVIVVFNLFITGAFFIILFFTIGAYQKKLYENRDPNEPEEL